MTRRAPVFDVDLDRDRFTWGPGDLEVTHVGTEEAPPFDPDEVDPADVQPRVTVTLYEDEPA